VGRCRPAVAEINTMELFADIGENPIVDSIAVLLLMALWGGAIVLIDH